MGITCFGWLATVTANVLVAIYKDVPPRLRVLGWPGGGWDDFMTVSVI